jgi:PAS domain S-box-containing protein
LLEKYNKKIMKDNNFNRYIFKPEDLNILIVEDSALMLKMLNQNFSTKGFNTFLASSLKEAREIIRKNRIDYIILDISLPDGSGYELIEDLKSTSIKIVVVTSHNDSLLKETFYDKGIIDFINKDTNFLYKISEIPNLIKQIEKNKFKNILVLDTCPLVRDKLKMIMLNRNYNVFDSSSTNEVLEIIKDKNIDLILMDLEIEDNSGYNFLVHNKKVILDELKIKIVFLTNNDPFSIIRDAFRLGVKEIIKKPYSVEELILKIDMFINDKDIEDEIESSKKLLEQYKNAVDRSSIVSKADAKGIITYVNQAFCDISGYSKEELLGKTHSIIRHEDMHSSIFEDMWYTIKIKKEPWFGKIKNKKKNGGDYWVQTIINPILDNDNNVVEYIGIGTDITQIEKLKTHFKKQYDLTQNNFNEIMNLSKLYEKAIDQSSIILRISPDKTINYANESFYKISGLTPKELIGKPYNFLNGNEFVYYKFLKEIKSKGIWKGKIKHIFKNNEEYHFLVTIIPIINLNGEIQEYMTIKHDITELVKLDIEIQETQKEIIYKMGEIGETRSKETGNHVKRVAEYSRLLALLWGMNKKDANNLLIASPMHDIGKVGIPDSILKKEGKLTNDEFEIMKEHAIIGYNILKDSNREILKAAAIVAKEHHEKWDGSGYPFGLKGEEIHIYGRITAIADVFDALGSERCYKKAWEDEKIFELLNQQKGKHFDPYLIELFFCHIDKFFEIRNKYKD